MADKDDSTPVLIVGGSLVGLSAAVFLAWRGVPTVLVERHAGSSPHPRAIGYTTRTLELFRAVGIELPSAQVDVCGLRRPAPIPGHRIGESRGRCGQRTLSRDPPQPRRFRERLDGVKRAEDRLQLAVVAGSRAPKVDALNGSE